MLVNLNIVSIFQKTVWDFHFQRSKPFNASFYSIVDLKCDLQQSISDYQAIRMASFLLAGEDVAFPTVCSQNLICKS